MATNGKLVPEPARHFTLSGYQVLKKWLSYREKNLLNRPPSPAEAQQFTCHVRRIAALPKQNPELDTRYRASSGGNAAKGTVRAFESIIRIST